MSQRVNNIEEKYQGSKKIMVGGHNIVPYIAELTKFMLREGIKLDPLPKVKFLEDKPNSEEPLGKTAYYDPQGYCVTLFTEGRHIKDILRSYCHEMIHHSQNVTDRLGEIQGVSDPQYAQKNKHLRKLEQEAFLRGNMAFRDWENGIDK